MSKKNLNQKQVVAAEQASFDHQYELDHQIVRGVFRSLKQKAAPLRFPLRLYKQDPIKFFPEDINGRPNYFVDGRTYEIPLFVANYLNNKCARPVTRAALANGQFTNQHQRDANGNFIYEAPTHTIEKEHRFMFVSTDFKPVKGWVEPSTLVEVQKKLVV